MAPQLGVIGLNGGDEWLEQATCGLHCSRDLVHMFGKRYLRSEDYSFSKDTNVFASITSGPYKELTSSSP